MSILNSEETNVEEAPPLVLNPSHEDINDFLDVEILKMLKVNSRMPNTEIARELGISEGTVRRRINRMIKAGVIKKFTVELKGL